MKINKLLCLLLALSLVFCLVGCANTSEPKEDPTNVTEADPSEPEKETEKKPEEETKTPDSTNSQISPLLYKVTDDKGNTIWLFGSIHVGYDYFYPLPDYVNAAYESSDAIAFEFDIKAFENDMEAQTEMLMKMVYLDGTTIKDHISADLYDRAVALLTQYGLYTSTMDMFMPEIWSTFLDQTLITEAGLDAELGIDNHLLDKAYADSKEILEVESAEFQYNMIASFSPELQELLLESTVAYFDDLEASKEELLELLNLWKSGDEAAFAAYLAEEGEFETEEEKLLYAEYNKAMVTDRNLTMADFAEDALASGKEVFICVGAAHVVGEGAMAELLAQRGYTVELVR